VFVDVGDGWPDDVPAGVLDELTRRTPGFAGWQQERWLFHCADAAAYVGSDESGGDTLHRFRCLHCGETLSHVDGT
jgi:uncharacterized protein CbrC (UPF0167 family)